MAVTDFVEHAYSMKTKKIKHHKALEPDEIEVKVRAVCSCGWKSKWTTDPAMVLASLHLHAVIGQLSIPVAP